MNKMSERTLLESLGIEVVSVEKGRVVATMPVDHRTHQPFGYLHGGASVALAETVASIGTVALIDPETQICFGLEINANHLKSVQSGEVTAIAETIHAGRTTAVWNIRIENEKNELICISRCTVAIVEKRKE